MACSRRQLRQVPRKFTRFRKGMAGASADFRSSLGDRQAFIRRSMTLGVIATIRTYPTRSSSLLPQQTDTLLWRGRLRPRGQGGYSAYGRRRDAITPDETMKF